MKTSRQRESVPPDGEKVTLRASPEFASANVTILAVHDALVQNPHTKSGVD
jgi:hypothetical protein